MSEVEQHIDAGKPHSHNRRAVVKGAAWSVPVIAAAMATPAMAASVPPVCPACFTKGALKTPFTSQSLSVGNKGTLAIVTTLNVSSASCGDMTLFQPAYTAIMTSAVLTMTDGKSYTSAAGLGTGAGTFGSVSVFNMNAIFNNVAFPNGGSLSNYNPKPASITVNFTMVVVGLPSLIKLECPASITFPIASTGTGVVFLGAGTVNYSGLVG